MRYVVLTVIISVIFCQAVGYKCDKGTCPRAAYGSSYMKCCNPHIASGICCPRDGTCCYHGTSNQCCKPTESCCWDNGKNDVKCCPKGTVCCPNRKRGACCFKTPAFVWIMLGLCGSIIVILLVLSMYNCIQEEYVEYNSQRVAGSLPSDNSWHYYDYGSTLSRPASRAPPSYEPPPSYSNHDSTRGNHSNTNSANNSTAENSNNRPKPPTPQTTNNALSLTNGAESRGTEYHSSIESRESQFHSTNSQFHSTASELQTDRQLLPDQGVLRTFYEHPVPKLQRMLCSQHRCVVDDGSCVYCMDVSDQEELPDLNETSDLEPEENAPNRPVENSKTTQLSDKDLSKSTFLQQKQIPENLLNVRNQRTVLH